MYMLDPDKGRRRRAIARDRARSFVHDTAAASTAALRDLRHRMQGVEARLRRMREGDASLDDLRLIERVRSRLGRSVAHPHALHVGALAGRVTVSGPILAHEVAPLLAAIRSVPGVRAIDDHLVAHEHAGSVPALQGAGRAAAGGAGRRWSPALRGAALAGGALLVLDGLRRHGLLGTTMALAGIACAARGATDRPLATLWREEVRRLPAPPGPA
jgi:hypothetical protein